MQKCAYITSLANSRNRISPTNSGEEADYLYMKTLCDLLQNAKDSEAKHNAEKFVNSVAAMLSDDYYQAYKSFDQISLDELRRVTASHITKLQNQ